MYATGPGLFIIARFGVLTPGQRTTDSMETKCRCHWLPAHGRHWLPSRCCHWLPAHGRHWLPTRRCHWLSTVRCYVNYHVVTMHRRAVTKVSDDHIS